MTSQTNVSRWIVNIAALVLLIPATLLYIFGMFIALLYGIFAGVGYLIFPGILILPGYGLFSLWCLVVIFDKVTFSKVPLFIYGGLIAGVIASPLFIYLFVLEAPRTSYITHYVNFLLFGGGPLILLLIIILLMLLKRPKMSP